MKSYLHMYSHSIVLSYSCIKLLSCDFCEGELRCLLVLQVLAPNGRLLLVANLANVDSLGLGDGICLTSDVEKQQLHPRKLTWQWNMTILNRRYIFNQLVFHCHVSFPGCTLLKFNSSPLKSYLAPKRKGSF